MREEHAKLVSLSAANLVATAVQPHGRVVLRANAAQAGTTARAGAACVSEVSGPPISPQTRIARGGKCRWAGAGPST